jgi:hypothetical protein
VNVGRWSCRELRGSVVLRNDVKIKGSATGKRQLLGRGDLARGCVNLEWDGALLVKAGRNDVNRVRKGLLEARGALDHRVSSWLVIAHVPIA